MEPWLIALISVLAASAVLFVLLFLFAALVYNFAFGTRYDKIPLLKYFTAEDFGLTARDIRFTVKGTTVRGYVYTKKDVEPNGKLIIFCHGMGAGHIAYTTEIAYFCNSGFTVLAADNIGCNFSDGKNIKGMYAGALAAIAAYDFAKQDGNLSQMKTYFVGHSWGGYSALCASAERQVDGVVAISAPDSPAKTIKESAAPVISRGFACLLYPFWIMVCRLKLGKNGNKSAAKCATKNGAPTLLIQGDKDETVKKSSAAYYFAEGENITKYLAAGKAHNPYNTEKAENMLGELLAAFKRKDISEEERKQYFENFDFTAATEEDEEVMQTIVSFLD